MSTASTPENFSLKQQFSAMFGGYRAEWLGNSLFELFTEPDYLPELLTARPCFLIGGRGTGKTTVLRGLSYEGQWAMTGDRGLRHDPRTWSYYGFYHRVNTNRVRAFEGRELSEQAWVRTFAHYVNLTFCEEVVRFLNWLPLHGVPQATLPAVSLSLVAEALHLKPVTDVGDLSSSLRTARVQFEAYINNIADGHTPPLSMLAQPLDILFEELDQIPYFLGKHFFFLVDEYENYSDYQQAVVNTVIKHSGARYTFKVGVKELGLRRRSTLNEDEQLISPADYERVDIGARLQGSTFADFAQRVCNDRVRRIPAQSGAVRDIRGALPGMSEAEEALKLGIAGHVRELRSELRGAASDEEIRGFDGLTPLEAYLVRFWAVSEQKPLQAVLRDALSDRLAWKTRLNNYQHAMLFALRRRRRGIHKYYCGWDTFVHLADGNIRYLLQLVYESLLRHVEEQGSLAEPVPFEEQTLAAQEVGRKNLTELEGLAVNGAQLTRLVLGLGRVFQVMARQPEGHTPEINQFYLEDAPVSLEPSEEHEPSVGAVTDLLRSAVMHQALVRAPANKMPISSGDTKDYDYALHPIFAAFFEYSHRRKRRMQLSTNEIFGLVEFPRQTIDRILKRLDRNPNEDLPNQLTLFAPYFNAVS